MQEYKDTMRFTKRMSRRHLLALAGAVAGSELLAACGGRSARVTPKPIASSQPLSASASSPTPGGTLISGTPADAPLVIEAFDFGYRTLGTIPGGVTHVQLINTGRDLHHAQFLLLNPGVTVDQISAALRQGPDAVFPLATVAGGAGLTGPNGMTEVILDLRPGQYIMACFAAGEDHIA